jgi:uroporphyrin-III C-methyltransferase
MMMAGEVYLVGAGPGDPGLITVKGKDLIERADVIVHDSLIGMDLLDIAKDGAEIIDVGKRGGCHKKEQWEINSLLVEKCQKGRLVVRLKGGDPFMFGRGGEEAEELRAEGLVVHVVPGVTSAISAPALAGIPVTHRDFASLVTFVTGHEGSEKESEVINWSALARTGGTVVILMGMSRIRRNMSRLMDHGMDPATPVAVVEKGSTPEQRVIRGTVSDIADRCEEAGAGAPAIIIVGGVATLRERLGDLL